MPATSDPAKPSCKCSIRTGRIVRSATYRGTTIRSTRTSLLSDATPTLARRTTSQATTFTDQTCASWPMWPTVAATQSTSTCPVSTPGRSTPILGPGRTPSRANTRGDPGRAGCAPPLQKDTCRAAAYCAPPQSNRSAGYFGSRRSSNGAPRRPIGTILDARAPSKMLQGRNAFRIIWRCSRFGTELCVKNR